MSNSRIEGIRIYIASFITLLTSIVGEDIKYVGLLIVVMFLDTVLGWLKAFKLGYWKSKKAKWGFSTKLVELALVGLMYKMDYTLGLNFLMKFAIFYYIIIELASMIENIHEAKLARIPESLLDISRELKVGIDKKIFKRLKDIIDKVLKD